jgi:hypothetical protein
MRHFCKLLSFWLILFSFTPLDCLADGTTPQPKMVKQKNPFNGFSWGLALVYSSQKGGLGDVQKEQGTNIVRVTRENASAARGAFEVHYFFGSQNPGQPVDWSWGPFVSLNTKPLENLDKGNVFSSLGVGLMLGIDVDPTTDGTRHSLNLGVGALVDTDVKELAPGVSNGVATAQDTLTVSKTKTGFMAILAYDFALN